MVHRGCPQTYQAVLQFCCAFYGELLQEISRILGKAGLMLCWKKHHAQQLNIIYRCKNISKQMQLLLGVDLTFFNDTCMPSLPMYLPMILSPWAPNNHMAHIEYWYRCGVILHRCTNPTAMQALALRSQSERILHHFFR